MIPPIFVLVIAACGGGEWQMRITRPYDTK